jgi:hypothetical protein
VHANGHAGGVEEAMVCLGERQWHHRVGDAVADQDAELADVRQSQQRSVAAGQRAVERNHAAELFGEHQTQTVGERGPFLKAGKVDPFGVDVVHTASLFHGVKDIVFHQRIDGPIGPQP